MAYPLPSSGGSHSTDAALGKPLLGRRSVLELARVYIASSAFGAALETLDRLAANSWDEEAHLLRAEALLGLGRVPEADRLLGPPLLPADRHAPVEERVTAWHENGDATSDAMFRPGELQISTENPSVRRKGAGRRERLAVWRFLIQLRIMHRNGGYRHVLELGRIFFRNQSQPASVAVARIATVVAQSMLALRHPFEAKALFEQILELYKRLGSNEGVADTLLGIANTQLLDCHWDEADALYQEARFRYEDMGQSDKALACMINLGMLRAKRGDLAGGRSVLLQALARVSQLGETRRRLGVQLGLGYVEMRLGDLKTARHWLLASLRLARAQGSLRSRGLAFEFLGELHLWQGHLPRARRCLEAGHWIARQLAPDGDLDFEIHRRLAELSLREGTLETARSHALEAQRMARRYGDSCEVAAADRVLAEIELVEGRVYDALKRTANARTTLGRVGESFERARLELLSIRLERKAGLLAPGSMPARVKEAWRYYANFPGCLLHWDETLVAELASGKDPTQLPNRPNARPAPVAAVPAPGSLCTPPSSVPPRCGAPQRQDSTLLSVVLVGDALRISGWNVSAAARSLGTSRSRLDRFIRNHGLHRPAPGPGA